MRAAQHHHHASRTIPDDDDGDTVATAGDEDNGTDASTRSEAGGGEGDGDDNDERASAEGPAGYSDAASGRLLHDAELIRLCDVLGVPLSDSTLPHTPPSPTTLRRAYLRVARTHHPDKTRAGDAVTFVAAHEAYVRLLQHAQSTAAADPADRSKREGGSEYAARSTTDAPQRRRRRWRRSRPVSGGCDRRGSGGYAGGGGPGSEFAGGLGNAAAAAAAAAAAGAEELLGVLAAVAAATAAAAAAAAAVQNGAREDRAEGREQFVPRYGTAAAAASGERVRSNDDGGGTNSSAGGKPSQGEGSDDGSVCCRGEGDGNCDGVGEDGVRGISSDCNSSKPWETSVFSFRGGKAGAGHTRSAPLGEVPAPPTEEAIVEAQWSGREAQDFGVVHGLPTDDRCTEISGKRRNCMGKAAESIVTHLNKKSKKRPLMDQHLKQQPTRRLSLRLGPPQQLQ
ncbi:hypothetical protein DFJ73DRAFT_798492 [Zopfochytrium polystomum]|nr:hypothetical protein DFJ73DRAFT_798492 [Zopfochytrium polystomum]